MFTYCLFCETASCATVAKIAEIILPCRAIRPRQIQHRLRKSQADDIMRDLLPGYIFLYFEEDPYPAVTRMRGIPGVLRMMGDAKGRYVLTGKDEEFAMSILRCGGVIGKLSVYEEGNMLHLDKSDLDILDVAIRKVDRRKHRMQIQLNFANTPTTTWVEYVVRKSIPDSNAVY